MSMNSMDGPKRHEMSLEDLLGRYKNEGQELENRWAEEVEKLQKTTFDYLQVSSPEELRARLENPRDQLSMMGFSFPIMYAGRLGQLYSGRGGVNATLIVFGYGSDMPEYPPQVIEAITNTRGGNDKTVVDGIVWRAAGIKNQYAELATEHNGTWVSENVRGEGLGYGLYRAHEDIFGKLRAEVAPQLSLLKLYLRLGYAPQYALNPISHEPLNFDVKETLATSLAESAEKLRFPIHLSR